MKIERGTRLYGFFVMLVVTATLGAAAVLFQAIGGGQHVASASASARLLPLGVDAAGVLLVLPLLSQLATGFRLTELPYVRFRAVHLRAAWAGAALLFLHGTGAVIHTLQAPGGPLPLVLIGLGAVMAVVVGLQLASGFGVSRYKRRALRPWHTATGVALLAAVLLHNALGVWHAVTG